ncbi:hypothetical protein [uncultured Microbacterium sp.]|uniref:hypothetical protein n=1 Tax=uncultured Microbacterium sp. TaxID=191216 RepID=UPI00260B72B1|nr:hypothetical protein [uncultured Microbacterium sp.]
MIKLVNVDRSWFTHTAAAAKQYIDVMDGRVNIPRELRDVALEGVIEWPADMALGLPQSDLTVIEVSSLKRHVIDTYELNAHKVWGAAKATGLDYRPIVQGNTESLPTESVLKPLRVAHTTEEELGETLSAIQARVGSPILLVDHLFSPLADGSPAAERVKLTATLRTVSAESGFTLFETESVIKAHGVVVALLDQNHYRPEFEETVGLSMLPALKKLLNERRSDVSDNCGGEKLDPNLGHAPSPTRLS